MDQSTKRKQLMSDSIIEHNDYPALCPAERFAGASDLRLDKMEIFNNYAVMVSFLLQYKILRAKQLEKNSIQQLYPTFKEK